MAGATGTATVAVRVNPLPTISSFSATPDQILVGQNVTFNVTASGGTGPLSYSYSALPALPTGCTSTNASSFKCQPILQGKYEFTVTVTDVFGKTVMASAELAITSSPIGSGSSSTAIPWWVWAVIAVVVLAAVVGLLVWWRSRPPPPTSANLNPPAGPPTTPPPTSWDEGGG